MCCSKVTLTVGTARRRGVDVPRAGRSLYEGLDTRRTFAVEFSKTGCRLCDGVKKPPTRARGQPSLRIVSDTSRADWLLFELQGLWYADLTDGRRSIAPLPRVSTAQNGAFRPAAALRRARRAPCRGPVRGRRSP